VLSVASDLDAKQAKAERKQAKAERKRQRKEDIVAGGSPVLGVQDMAMASSATLSAAMASVAPSLSAALAADASHQTNGSDPSLAARAADGDASAAALAAAVRVAQRAAEKRRISFDLGKNVVCEFGSPLPPAHVRTPPSAKPQGSALKRGGSLPPGHAGHVSFGYKAKKRRRSQ
jgi:hypothetical protein